eukprot:GEMP01084815.1.p1 GENE.GEMP01084815.1~~GEMP01084815.1.p1  ORF type:complete len:159 (+),score=37.52 GEMP01084815.1:318-794(+)
MKSKIGTGRQTSPYRTILTPETSSTRSTADQRSLVGSPAEAFVRKKMEKLAEEEKRFFYTVNRTTRDKTYMRKQLTTFKKQIQTLREQQQVTYHEAKTARGQLREALGGGQEAGAAGDMCCGPREPMPTYTATASILDRVGDPPESEDDNLQLIESKV